MEATEFKIKIFDWPSNAGGYKDVQIDQSDARSSDPLIRLSDFNIACESFYARTDGENWPYNCPIQGSLPDVWCRTLVAEKLGNANVLLKSHGAEVYVWDAYRPIETQTGLWDFFWKQSGDAMPGATDDERRKYVLDYVSDPTRFDRSDTTTWPVHSSGGAVDLTLRSLEDGRLLDMGAAFDEMRAVSHSDSFERALVGGDIGEHVAALKNRRLLHWAMERVGFVNYPLEFWHFDWGDQMYVHHLALMGRLAPKAAWYGYVDAPN